MSDRQPPDEPPPPGWVRFTSPDGTTVLKLTPDHPRYPEAWRSKRARADRARLAQDPAIQAALDALLQRTVGALHPSSTLQERLAAVAAAVKAADEEAIRTGPRDIPTDTRITYLVEQALTRATPSRSIPLAETRDQPVTLLLNTGDLPTELTLYPGEIAIRFARLASRDLGQTLAPFITEAQAILGHTNRRAPGGRPGRDEDPVKTEQAKTAAKLHHWRGWSYDEIGAFFGWTGTTKAVRERVRRAVRAGETTLTEEVGPGWQQQPPPALSQRDR